MSGPRHTTVDSDARLAALQSSENARDTLAEIARRAPVQQRTVEAYTATGSTSTRIRIGSSERPWAVLLARAAQAYGEDAPVAAVMTPNFVWDATDGSVDVFEPSGLTANTVYLLQFLVVEAI